MDMYGFYTGKIFNAYEYLGAHLENDKAVIRVFAPNAEAVGVIGDFSNWNEISMQKIYDGNFYECHVPNAEAGMRYKIRIHEKSGRIIDHSDPYGFSTELRPQNASILYDRHKYHFKDGEWMNSRTDGKNKAVNIYELHIGSWKTKTDDENGWFHYDEIAKPLIDYVKENGYNYIEIMPLCEYPLDASWGYQAIGFFSPTSRYGEADGLKELVNKCHQNGIGVILDFAPVHFAVNDYGLANFDGTPLYEYPHTDVAYNEWGSKNFAHSRGEVRSFLQSAVKYWLEEFHFDGIRIDAVRNMIYWQGDTERGVNHSAVEFIQYMNKEIKKQYPDVMLIAEDSTAYPMVTAPVDDGGLGFDYKWDMGWMHDTLEYFQGNTAYRSANYHKLTFSMHYFYSERFILPLSHDEVVHGKATILQKMNGEYEEKFPQARALYMYMYAHPGKKLNFMGNEIGQLREWSETQQQDWEILKYPKHDVFHHFMTDLNNIYLKYDALSKEDYDGTGFQWADCSGTYKCVYAFLRKTDDQQILAVYNFSDTEYENYTLSFEHKVQAELLLNSDWECYGGTTPKLHETLTSKKYS